jgi:putative ABC transport system substrate-binding protein
MNRTLGALLVSLTLAILVAPLATDAQQPAKGPRVGWLSDGMRAGATSRLHEAFRHGLRDLGYVEGQNLVIEHRYAEGSQERLADLAAELVRLKVDVIVAGGAYAIRAAQHATRTIPIVMAGTSDPVAQGFIASLARPGGEHHGLE